MTESVKINNSYVSEKISRIRFVPDADEPNKFLTGGWDAPKNYLRLYEIPLEDEFSPICLAKQQMSAEVTGLEFIGTDHVCVSLSNGDVTFFQLNHDLNTLREVIAFRDLHTTSCTGISVFETNVASVSEDGSLIIVSAAAKSTVKAFNNVDSCSLTCVSFVSHKEILTGNRMGIVKVFDIRTDDQKPTVSMAVSCEDEKKSNALMCMASHPTQNHIILGGSEEGSITVFDLRQPLFPAAYLTAHSSSICEIAFHKEPNKLFTASENGELWQWAQNTTPTLMDFDVDGGNPWLNSERAKSKINVTSLISGIGKSINTFDTHRSKIICGSDNEAIYLIENLY